MLSENMRGHCWHCGQALKAADYHREAHCPGCGKPCHCCMNCGFHQPGIANQCREPIADIVHDKQRANFCAYFEPGRKTGATIATADSLRKAAEDLFR